MLGLSEVMKAQSPSAHPGLVTLKSLGEFVLSPQQSTIPHVKKDLTGAPNGHVQLILTLIVLEKNKRINKKFSGVICYRQHVTLREQFSPQLLARRPPPLGCLSTDPNRLQTPWWDNSIPLENRESERKSTEQRQGCFISSPCDSSGLNGFSLFFPYCNLDTMPV